MQYTNKQFEEMMINKVAPQIGDTILHDDGSIREVKEVMAGTHINLTQWIFKSDAMLEQEANFAREQAIQEANRQKQENILNLKRQLSDTDYKVIKCYEYSLTGKEMPYNIVELNEQRDAIRAQINGLKNA